MLVNKKYAIIFIKIFIGQILSINQGFFVGFKHRSPDFYKVIYSSSIFLVPGTIHVV